MAKKIHLYIIIITLGCTDIQVKDDIEFSQHPDIENHPAFDIGSFQQYKMSDSIHADLDEDGKAETVYLADGGTTIVVADSFTRNVEFLLPTATDSITKNTLCHLKVWGTTEDSVMTVDTVKDRKLQKHIRVLLARQSIMAFGDPAHFTSGVLTYRDRHYEWATHSQ